MATHAWKAWLPGVLLGLVLSIGPVEAQGPPAAGHGPYFPADAPWYRDVSNAPVDAESATVINWLSSVGGWGGGRMQIDFSIEVLEADASTPFRSFTPTADFYNPDCDFAPVPLPPGGALEGEAGYQCVSDGDCHLLVVHRPTNRLYEMWRANLVGGAGGQLNGGCLAVWNMNLTDPPAGRGQDCTSADAAGFPIAPLLFNADEVAAGHVDHALRFILPNSRMRRKVYVHPATHSTFATSGPAAALPYGARLRLRADYPVQNLPTAGARTVARAMQKYGILLADGGTIALTAQSDRFTAARWSGLLGPLDLSALKVTDFQMVAAGDRFNYAGDCARTTPLFNDGLELGDLSKWSGTTP
jgi:serine/threonine-protein kinase